MDTSGFVIRLVSRLRCLGDDWLDRWMANLVESAGQNINNSSTVEIDKQKQAYSEKVIEPSVRRRISRVVASINKLK